MSHTGGASAPGEKRVKRLSLYNMFQRKILALVIVFFRWMRLAFDMKNSSMLLTSQVQNSVDIWWRWCWHLALGTWLVAPSRGAATDNAVAPAQNNHTHIEYFYQCPAGRGASTCIISTCSSPPARRKIDYQVVRRTHDVPRSDDKQNRL